MADFLWVEKYRPKTIEECILPEDIKSTFQNFLKQGEIPNLLLSGMSGLSCVSPITKIFKIFLFIQPVITY